MSWQCCRISCCWLHFCCASPLFNFSNLFISLCFALNQANTNKCTITHTPPCKRRQIIINHSWQKSSLFAKISFEIESVCVCSMSSTLLDEMVFVSHRTDSTENIGAVGVGDTIQLLFSISLKKTKKLHSCACVNKKNWLSLCFAIIKLLIYTQNEWKTKARARERERGVYLTAWSFFIWRLSHSMKTRYYNNSQNHDNASLGHSLFYWLFFLWKHSHAIVTVSFSSLSFNRKFSLPNLNWCAHSFNNLLHWLFLSFFFSTSFPLFRFEIQEEKIE